MKDKIHEGTKIDPSEIHEQPPVDNSTASVGYKKLPVIEDTNLLPLDEVISVGFGSAMLLRNGKPVWAESGDYEYSECLTVKQAESMASLYPEDDWRIHLVGPLSEFCYQRQGKGKWLMYKRGHGFA